MQPGLLSDTMLDWMRTAARRATGPITHTAVLCDAPHGSRAAAAPAGAK